MDWRPPTTELRVLAFPSAHPDLGRLAAPPTSSIARSLKLGSLWPPQRSIPILAPRVSYPGASEAGGDAALAITCRLTTARSRGRRHGVQPLAPGRPRARSGRPGVIGHRGESRLHAGRPRRLLGSRRRCGEPRGRFPVELGSAVDTSRPLQHRGPSYGHARRDVCQQRPLGCQPDHRSRDGVCRRGFRFPTAIGHPPSGKLRVSLRLSFPCTAATLSTPRWLRGRGDE